MKCFLGGTNIGTVPLSLPSLKQEWCWLSALAGFLGSAELKETSHAIALDLHIYTELWVRADNALSMRLSGGVTLPFPRALIIVFIDMCGFESI